MTSRDFAYWLQGFFEITDAKEITPEQVDLIKRHLNLVFYHEIDPSYTSDKKKQQEMQNIHDGKPKEEIVLFPSSGNGDNHNWPNNGYNPQGGHDTVVRC